MIRSASGLLAHRPSTAAPLTAGSSSSTTPTPGDSGLFGFMTRRQVSQSLLPSSVKADLLQLVKGEKRATAVFNRSYRGLKDIFGVVMQAVLTSRLGPGDLWYLPIPSKVLSLAITAEACPLSAPAKLPLATEMDSRVLFSGAFSGISPPYAVLQDSLPTNTQMDPPSATSPPSLAAPPPSSSSTMTRAAQLHKEGYSLWYLDPETIPLQVLSSTSNESKYSKRPSTASSSSPSRGPPHLNGPLVQLKPNSSDPDGMVATYRSKLPIPLTLARSPPGPQGGPGSRVIPLQADGLGVESLPLDSFLRDAAFATLRHHTDDVLVGKNGGVVSAIKRGQSHLAGVLLGRTRQGLSSLGP